jgi:hypothetical protein
VILDEEILRKAYIEASEDPDRKEVIEDWAELDYEAWGLLPAMFSFFEEK